MRLRACLPLLLRFPALIRRLVLLFSFPRKAAACHAAAGSTASAAMSPAAGRPASRGTRAAVPACQTMQPAGAQKMAYKGNSGHSAAKLLLLAKNGIYRRENAPERLFWALMRPPKYFGRRRPHTLRPVFFGLVFIDGLAFLKKKRKPPSGAATGRRNPDRTPCTELYTKISPGALSILTKPPEISFNSAAFG